MNNINSTLAAPSVPAEAAGSGGGVSLNNVSQQNPKPAPTPTMVSIPPSVDATNTNGTVANDTAAAVAVTPPPKQHPNESNKKSLEPTTTPQVASSVSLMNGEIPGSNPSLKPAAASAAASVTTNIDNNSNHNSPPQQQQQLGANSASSPNIPIPNTPPDKPGPLKPENRVLSATETALATKPKSVTMARKEELLEAARASRLEWIRQVPFPYNNKTQTNNNNNSAQHVDPLQELRETHAGRRLPSALQVLEHLYGFPDQANNAHEAKRIEALLQQQQQQQAESSSSPGGHQYHQYRNAVPTPEQARKMTLEDDDDEKDEDEVVSPDQEGTTVSPQRLEYHRRRHGHSRALLRSYHLFLQNLAEPAAAMLVQGMRNFCRNLCLKQPQPQPTNDTERQQQSKDTLIRMLQSYIASTLDSIRGHELWREDMETAEAIAASNNQSSADDESLASSLFMVKRSLESFLYGQCRAHIDTVFWTFELEKTEQEWDERVDALQFVTAAHLEVACLQDESQDFVRHVLRGPVAALQSVPEHHAPFEKLQRVLAMYRGINGALSKALNKNRPQGSEAKLPSADDVLPAIILTVLQAKPVRLQYHLQLIDDFCPPEALRGEAGYAYTNLFGAIQFISDLNLDVSSEGDVNESQTTPDSLSISAHEFQKGLETCRAAAQERMAKAAAKSEQVDKASAEGALEDTAKPARAPITPRDIQSARARGEVLDMDWAMRMQQKEPKPFDELVGMDGEVEVGAAEVEEDKEGASATPQQQSSASVPSGFKRSYTFLSLQPQDIKVTDLPKLLEEYRQMVHTTEELLAERQARLSSEKKEHFAKHQADLHARVKEVDPSLLADSSLTATTKANSTSTG